MATENLAPLDWQGDLKTEYYLGPKLQQDWKVRLQVHTTSKLATAYNTIGILNGREERGKLFFLIIKKKHLKKYF